LDAGKILNEIDCNGFSADASAISAPDASELQDVNDEEFFFAFFI
jgi:hypothetical protein